MKLQNLPVKKLRITSPYGPRDRDNGFHNGTDLGPEDKTRPYEPIYAVADGIVQVSKNNPGGYGLYIVIEHDKVETVFCTLYSHLSKLMVNVGDRVISGQQIGVMGDTGDSDGVHLHFEIRACVYSKFWEQFEDRYYRCVDAAQYLTAVVSRNTQKVLDGSEAIKVLESLGLVNPDAYWLKAIDTVKYLEGLLIKLTNYILRNRV